jgi:hypothetical protein
VKPHCICAAPQRLPFAHEQRCFEFLEWAGQLWALFSQDSDQAQIFFLPAGCDGER